MHVHVGLTLRLKKSFSIIFYLNFLLKDTIVNDYYFCSQNNIRKRGNNRASVPRERKFWD